MTLPKERTSQVELKTFPQNRKMPQISEHIGLQHSRIAKRNIPKHLLVNRHHLFIYSLFGTCLTSSAAETQMHRVKSV